MLVAGVPTRQGPPALVDGTSVHRAATAPTGYPLGQDTEPQLRSQSRMCSATTSGTCTCGRVPQLGEQHPETVGVIGDRSLDDPLVAVGGAVDQREGDHAVNDVDRHPARVGCQRADQHVLDDLGPDRRIRTEEDREEVRATQHTDELGVRDHGQPVHALLAHESSGGGDRGPRIDRD